MDSPRTQDSCSLNHPGFSFSTPRWSYDVFLSFRGADTRNNIIAHLYTAFIAVGIHTFRDDDELPRGNDISSELLKAIQESRISLVLFSKNYASSRWCLDELVKILDCKKTIGQLVFPVFYYVDPADVRKQTGSFAAAFQRHEACFSPEKVRSWRAALTEAANLAGWDFQTDARRSESEFIENIVKEVQHKVGRKLFVANHPVGLDSRVENLKALLRIYGSDDVLVVGIYGMGGIGKTTIAKYFYNSAIHHYEGSCFLANVREESKQFNGLVRLQEQFLSELTGKNHKVANVDKGICLIKERLGCRRVLVVLDDLEELSQLDSLIGGRSWFGKRSLIILTTRDEHLLDQAEVTVKYKMNELSHEESLRLLCWHAFHGPSPLENYKELSEDTVNYTGGLPLALEVLGSSLFKKTMVKWNSMLQKLKVIPNNKIQAKLKISFDALDDDMVKDIFLDIACFFVGMDRDYATKIFEACGFFGDIGVSTLIDRCLLRISIGNRLGMHDLVRDMGRGIVREGSPKEPGKRTRLWQQDEACDVLTSDKASEAIEGIFLDLPMQVHFSTRPFVRMPNLRLLKINNANLRGSFEGLFKELRWLCWHWCPLKTLPSELHPKKLVLLDMQQSNLSLLWQGTKVLNDLKILNLSGSRFLITTPDFSGARNLEELRLQGCPSLSNLHPSIGVLEKLITLDLSLCYKLNSLPSSIGRLRSLKELNLGYSSCLEGLPRELGHIQSLRILKLGHSGIKQLPHSVGLLNQLEELILGNCENLKWLPSSICNLRKLGYLHLAYCLNLRGLPQRLGDIEGLRKIDATGTGIRRLPDSIGNLGELTELCLSFCTSLESLPSSIGNLRSLEILQLHDCSKLEQLPEELGNLVRLNFLDAYGTAIRTLPCSIGLISNLGRLCLSKCKELKSLPITSSIQGRLASRNMDTGRLPSLAMVNCNLLDAEIPFNFCKFSMVRSLELSANSFCTLPSCFGQLSYLEELYLIHCRSLQSVLGLPPNLRRLEASGCTSLEKLPNISNMLHLLKMNVRNCARLTAVQGLENLHSVEEIHLQGCTALLMTFGDYFFQEHGGLRNLHDSACHFSRWDTPEWFEYLGISDSKICLHVPLDVEYEPLILTCWVDYVSLSRRHFCIRMRIKNKTSGSEWSYVFGGHPLEYGTLSSCMFHHKPKYPIKSGDKIEVLFDTSNEMSASVKVERVGVHLASRKGKHGKFSRRNHNEIEASGNASKRLKQA